MPQPQLAAIGPLPVNRFPSKLAPKVAYSILKNPPFCYFAASLIVWITPFTNKSDSSSDLTIFIIPFISSIKIINAVVPDPNIFLWIATSAADAAAVNPNGIKTLLANGLSTLQNKDNPNFNKS